MKTWAIYHADREFARTAGDPMLAIVSAETKEEAEQVARERAASDGATAPVGLCASPLSVDVIEHQAIIRGMQGRRYATHKTIVLQEGTSHMSSDRVCFETKHLQFVERNGWGFVRRPSGPDVVVIIAITSENNLLLVEQYRPPIAANAIELPAGVVGDNNPESVLDAAKRELIEETGYEASGMALAARCAVSPGLTNEMVNICIAIGLRRVGNGGGRPEEDEKITVHEAPLDQINTWLLRRQDHAAIAASIYTGLHLYDRLKDTVAAMQKIAAR